MRWFVIAILMSSLIIPAHAINVSVKAGGGIVGKPTNFTITLSEGMSVKTLPVDVMLVMDCSGSMSRYGNLITTPKEVNLTNSWQMVGEFVLKNESYVEIVFQTPNDTYNDVPPFEAYVVNEDTGYVSMMESNYDAVRWYLYPGRYEVYARLKCCCNCKVSTRIFYVELPPERLELAKMAANNFINMLNADDRVGVAEFSSYHGDYADWSAVVAHLTYDKSYVKYIINNSLYASGATPMGYGLQLAINELKTNGRKDATHAIVLLTDGWWNEGPNPIDVVESERGIVIYTIGYGYADEGILKSIAEMTGGKYYYAVNESELNEIYKDIAMDIRYLAKDVTLKVVLTNVSLVDEEPKGTVTGNVLVWHLDYFKGPVNFTVTVVSSKTGKIKVADCYLNYTDANGTFHSDRFEVYMEFINHPPSISVYGNTDVYEKRWLVLTIRAIDPDGHDVDLSYVAPISGIFYRINGTTWVLKWMPSENFVTSGIRTFTIEFIATDSYGARSERNVTITVHDSKKWLLIWTNKNRSVVYEGNVTTFMVYVDSSSPYTLTYTVSNGGDYLANLQPFRNCSLFSFAPQYGFTDDVRNVTVTFTAKNRDGLTASTCVTIEVLNVNVTTYAEFDPSVTMRELHNRTFYVGQRIDLAVRFVNSTEGIVEVNDVPIWSSTLPMGVVEREVSFIPNAPGVYNVSAIAINGSIEKVTRAVPIVVSIKPIS